jgi:hypothetical protein
MRFDNDFSDILHESRFEKQKPMLIALLVVIAMIAAVSWAISVYLNQSTGDSNAATTGATRYNDEQSAGDTSETSTVEETPNTTVEAPAASSTGSNTRSSSNQSSGNSSSNTYDSNKCDPLKSQADSLKTTSDQKKTTYDNAFAARKNYGYFYDQYGNSTDAQRAYDAQEDQLNSLQKDWQDALNKQNVAYRKYQECRASL